MAKLFRATVRGETGGEAFANVIHVYGDKTAQEACSAVYTHWIDNLTPLMGNHAKFTSVTCQEVGHLILDPEYYTQVEDAPGANGTTTDPQLAGCLSLHTGLSGKHRRGRIFLAGIRSDLVVDGKIEAGYYTQWTARINTQIAGAWFGASPTSGMNLVVFSRSIFNGLSDIFLDSFKNVTTATLNQTMSTMRTRKPSPV